MIILIMVAVVICFMDLGLLPKKNAFTVAIVLKSPVRGSQGMQLQKLLHSYGVFPQRTNIINSQENGMLEYTHQFIILLCNDQHTIQPGNHQDLPHNVP
jgi:hypothetical protein